MKLKSFLTLFLFILLSSYFVAYAQVSDFIPSPSVLNLVNQGIELHKNKDFPGAIKAFKEALSIEPNNALVRQNLSIAHNNYGKYLHERTDYEKALSEFRYSLYYDPENKTADSNLDSLLLQRGVKAKDPTVRKQLGDKLRAEASFELALVEYLKAKMLATAPDVDTLISLGDIYYIIYLREGQKTRDINKALDLYKNALSIKDSAKARVKVGDALLGLRDVVNAIDHYKKALELEPDNPEVLTANVRGWNEAIRLAPLVAENHIGLAHALQLKRDFPAAEEEYNQALKLDPENDVAKEGLKSLNQDKQTAEAAKFFDLALKLQSEGKYDESLNEYLMAVQISPNDPKLHYNIGTAFQAKGDIPHAETAYKKSLELDPNYEKSKAALDGLEKQATTKKVKDLVNRALELQGAEKYQEAIAAYNAALEITPQDANLIFNLGTAYQASGDFDKAKENYKKATEVDMSNPAYEKAIKQVNVEIANPLIQSAINKQTAGDYAGAIADYKKALELLNEDAQTYFNLATAYQANKQLDEAIQAYQKAIQLDSKGQLDSYFFIGTIYEEKKNNTQATINFKKYIELSPAGSYAKDAKEHIDYLKSLGAQ